MLMRFRRLLEAGYRAAYPPAKKAEGTDMTVTSFGWAAEGLHDAKGPDLAVRSVYEARLLQRALRLANPQRGKLGIELGAGYGRLTPVLADYCDKVIGFEREPALVQAANAKHRDCTFTQIEVLWDLPLETSSVDIAMTFTVLQHMSNDDADRVLGELDRVVGSKGIVVLTEDYADIADDESKFDKKHLFTVRRPVTYYHSRLRNFQLLGDFDRILERGTWAGDHVVGKAMAFQRMD